MSEMTLQIFFTVLLVRDEFSGVFSLRFCKSERGEGSSPGVPQYHNQPSDLVSSKLLFLHKEESTLLNKLTKKLEEYLVMITSICMLYLLLFFSGEWISISNINKY